MSKKIKIYMPLRNEQAANWIEDKIIVNRIEDADLVMFLGGEDVHPSLYGEKQSKYVRTNFKRDMKESTVFLEAKKKKIKTLGICRGAQLLCALSNGKVIQHQENPAYIHEVVTTKGLFQMTSTHHNAMNPFNLHPADYSILGWTREISRFHFNGEGEESYKHGQREVEICHFKNTDSLGIQPHPEYMYGKKEFDKEMEYFNTLLNSFMSSKL